MKKVTCVALLALLVANGATAAQYALDNEKIAVTFDEGKSALAIKDKAGGSGWRRRSCFF